MNENEIKTQSGQALGELTMEAVLAGRLEETDFRISAEQLLRQAEAAEAAGYRQLGANFRRAAELTAISNEEVLAIYNELRPGRTTYPRLLALAARLEDDLAAPLTATLVREAADIYLALGLIAK